MVRLALVAAGILLVQLAWGCGGSTTTNSSDAGRTVVVKGTRAAAATARGGGQTNCMRVPSACGYPDRTNTGVPAGMTLTSRSGDVTVTTPGTTIAGIALTGTIAVDASNTRIENSEVTVDGTQGCGSSSCGGKGIWIEPGVTGTVIEDVTCRGGASSGVNVTQYCIMNNGSTTRFERVHAYNCTECLAGPGEVSDSLIEADGTIPGEHYEDIYYGGGDGPLIVNHDTLLNPQSQTAVVFASVDFGDQAALTITDNLMAGGGYVIYGGASGSGGKALGPVRIADNRFSRRYYPNGGSYGVAAYLNSAVTSWSGNVWDETRRPVGE